MKRERAVDWTLFFDAPGAAPAQRCKKINGGLARSLIELRQAITGECEIDAYHSLAGRVLQRGHSVGLPSGEAVARYIGIDPLTSDQIRHRFNGERAEISTDARGKTPTDAETPLWYILREADVCTGGNRLGPVDGQIVTEVLVGLIDADPTPFVTTPNGTRRKHSMTCCCHDAFLV